jgi:hypothetical protein
VVGKLVLASSSHRLDGLHPGLIEKVTQMDADLPEWTADDIGNIAAPTMLVIGDSEGRLAGLDGRGVPRRRGRLKLTVVSRPRRSERPQPRWSQRWTVATSSSMWTWS